MKLLSLEMAVLASLAHGFMPIAQQPSRKALQNEHSMSKDHIAPVTTATSSQRMSSTSLSSSLLDDDAEEQPQAVATGYSQNTDMVVALEEATQAALLSLPPGAQIDLGLAYVSSIYDGQHSPTLIVPTIVEMCKVNGHEVQKLIGCNAGGLVGTKPNTGGARASTVESEGLAGITVTFMVLPSTSIQTFHLTDDDVPDDNGAGLSPKDWKQLAGMSHIESDADDIVDEDDAYSFMLLPAPSFQKELDDYLRGLQSAFGPLSTIFGALSSTVSSLSRAKLFRYDVDRPNVAATLTEGCVGIAMKGDARLKIMLAQGAKPVGGVYRVISGQDSTIGAIQLDELATDQLKAAEEGMEEFEDEDDDDEDDAENSEDVKKRMAAAYAKAAIPKPVLAECNYLMKTLSDDDQAFMRKHILVGLERGGQMGKNPSELIRLAKGLGHRFTVHQVASAGMRDGSVTLPLGSVDVEPGTRLRFFVRDGEFAKKEVEAIWTGYKKRELEKTFLENSDEQSTFKPSGCLLFPTLDRGQTMFGGKAGFESNAVSEFAPAVPSISGFFSNGVIAAVDSESEVMVHGSASCYALIGSKSDRPIYSAAKAFADRRLEEERVREETEAEVAAEALNERRMNKAKDLVDLDEDRPAPRSEDGELIIKRREIHSGRALTVSAVQWSVAEKMAQPTSVLEGFMWDKETEVDRFRERVPLSNLVSQCKLSDMDPTKPKPRDWIGPVREAAKDSSFVIIPELKRLEPTSGSLRKRYDISKLTKQIVDAKVPAFGINCDPVLFGGSLEDLTEGREATSKAMLESANSEDGVVLPPILASDLILYPYQLYKLRLAGADAINLVVGALTSKDLLYLSKIAASMKMSVVASVTSEVQIKAITKLGGISAISVSNRDLETFTMDETGVQALTLLKSEAMEEFKKSNPDSFIFAEGRVGNIETEGEEVKGEKYIEALKDAGALGAIVGGVNWAEWHKAETSTSVEDLA